MTRSSRSKECLTKGEFRNIIYYAFVPATLLLVAVFAFLLVQASNTQHKINHIVQVETQTNAAAICKGDWQRWHGREGLREAFFEFFDNNPDQGVADKYRAVLDEKLPSLPVPDCIDPFVAPMITSSP